MTRLPARAAARASVLDDIVERFFEDCREKSDLWWPSATGSYDPR